MLLALALLQVLYLVLLLHGPAFGASQGVMIQATGQKANAYASIICVFIQSLGARKQLS